MKSKLDNSWDDFFEQFMRTLLADGYDEFEILDKMMAVFKSVRKSRVSTPCTLKLTNKPNETLPNEEKKHKKYPDNRKNPCRFNNPHNYDRTLSSKFEHAVVYVKGNKDASLATIEVGPNQRVKDVYRVISTGKTYNGDEYLKEFNLNVFDTPKGFSYLNQHAIVFEVNPQMSIGYLKLPTNYGKFNSIDDIRSYTKKRNK